MEIDTENGAAWSEAKEPRGTVKGRKDTPSPAADGYSYLEILTSSRRAQFVPEASVPTPVSSIRL